MPSISNLALSGKQYRPQTAFKASAILAYGSYTLGAWLFGILSGVMLNWCFSIQL